jgi:enoyl-[acyl-carrier protein] reductase II
LSREEAQWKLEEFWVGALRRAVHDGDVERGSLMAGQSVAFVKSEQTVKEIIEELIEKAECELSAMTTR